MDRTEDIKRLAAALTERDPDLHEFDAHLKAEGFYFVKDATIEAVGQAAYDELRELRKGDDMMALIACPAYNVELKASLEWTRIEAKRLDDHPREIARREAHARMDRYHGRAREEQFRFESVDGDQQLLIDPMPGDLGHKLRDALIAEEDTPDQRAAERAIEIVESGMRYDEARDALWAVCGDAERAAIEHCLKGQYEKMWGVEGTHVLR